MDPGHSPGPAGCYRILSEPASLGYRSRNVWSAETVGVVFRVGRALKRPLKGEGFRATQRRFRSSPSGRRALKRLSSSKPRDCIVSSPRWCSAHEEAPALLPLRPVSFSPKGARAGNASEGGRVGPDRVADGKYRTLAPSPAARLGSGRPPKHSRPTRPHGHRRYFLTTPTCPLQKMRKRFSLFPTAHYPADATNADARPPKACTCFRRTGEHTRTGPGAASV